MTANMTTCDRCGSSVPVGASTCPNCGAPVGAAAYETVKLDADWSGLEARPSAEREPPGYEPTVKVPEPPAEKVAQPAVPPPAFTPPAAAEPPKGNRVWAIVGGCAALLVICCCLAAVAVAIVAWQMGAI